MNRLGIGSDGAVRQGEYMLKCWVTECHGMVSKLGVEGCQQSKHNPIDLIKRADDSHRHDDRGVRGG